MFVDSRDLIAELSGRGGEPFAEFMRGLIEAEAATHGIGPSDIDWDYRVNRPDGGCDLFIKKGHGQKSPRFVPAVPSVWSFKSGDDGKKAATLRAELTDDSHGRLLEHLRRGDAYVWCPLQAVSQPERDDMYKKRNDLAVELGFDPAKVEFRWVDALASTLEEHPNLIARYLPALGRIREHALTLDQWMQQSPDSLGFEVNWVSLPGRDDLKARIRDHLLGNDGPTILHIAGISGIGKTRTAIQACRDEGRLADRMLYVPRFEDLSESFLRHIEEPGRHIRLIIDEVSLAEYGRLSDRFRNCGERIRLVTLGAARRGERTRPSEPTLLVMQEPADEGVLEFVHKVAGARLEKAVQRNLAERSGHDLRLALMLVHGTQSNPQMAHLPVRTLDNVWDRVVERFGDHVRSVERFHILYEALTAAIDIGHDGKYRGELDYLASHFGVPPADLSCAVAIADECGLGVRTARFFEAGPRALAVWVFQDRLWRRLRRDIAAFLANMPSERLRRRFLERCRELESPKREEVLDCVGQFFLSWLGHPNLMRLSDREASRVFEAWAELDPERGLPWLVRAAENTGNEELREFQGSPDGSGGWRGRRQVVWLCEHLACFKEYFWHCERVLFRLAQVETEESIANNSRNTWKNMFLPVLSNTEVPFPERLEHLLGRLRDASDETFDLLLSASLDMLDDHIARECAPAVVGGRVVPDEWRPRTRRELFEIEAEAGRKLLAEVARLSLELRRRGSSGVIEHLSRFLYRNLLSDVRDLLRTVTDDEELTRALRAAIDQVVAFADDEDEGAKRPPFLPALKEWRRELTPDSLREQIVDLTAREYWSVYRGSLRGAPDDPAAAYREAAEAILNDLALLGDLGEWLNSEDCRSGDPLGFEMGKADGESRAMALILEWLGTGRAVAFASGYIRGAAYRIKSLPSQAVPLLDALAEQRPALAVQVCIEADRSPSGFERIMHCIVRLEADQLAKLRLMAFAPWPEALAEEQKDRLLGALVGLADSTNSDALDVAFALLAGWTEYGKRPPSSRLATRRLRMLELAARPGLRVGDYDWKVVAGLLSDESPAEVAEILADAITDVRSHRFQRRRDALDLFKDLARDNPKVAMEAIGRWILDDDRGTVFCMWEFRGLFDAIGLKTVRPWVQKHGDVGAVRIARHLDGPSLDEKGNPAVPELADWLLSEFENVDRVFSEFCMGRHSGVVRFGHARDRREEVERLVGPFRAHKRRWLQKWAKYELDDLEYEIKRDEEHEDELERT